MVACALALTSLAACSELEPYPIGDEQHASFDVRPGVEIVTVTHADPRVPLTLYDGDGNQLLT